MTYPLPSINNSSKAAGSYPGESQAGSFSPLSILEETPPSPLSLDSPSLGFTNLVRSLASHRYRMDYLTSILAYLRLPEIEWLSVGPVLLRRETVSLQDCGNLEYQFLPYEMIAHAQRIKEHDEFGRFRVWVIRCVVSGATPRQAVARRSAAQTWSRGSSTLSSVSTFSNSESNLNRDSMSSVGSDALPGHGSRVSTSSSLVREESRRSDNKPLPDIPGTSTSRALPDTKRFTCPFGCIKRGKPVAYTSEARLANHFKMDHTDAPIALLSASSPAEPDAAPDDPRNHDKSSGTGMQSFSQRCGEMTQAVKQATIQPYLRTDDGHWSANDPDWPETFPSAPIAYPPRHDSLKTSHPKQLATSDPADAAQLQSTDVDMADANSSNTEQDPDYNAGHSADLMYFKYIQRTLR